MKSAIRTSIVCALVCVTALVRVSSEGDIPWRTSVRTASAAAAPMNKPMLIEFWATWCPPCNVMDQQVYPNPMVKEAMTKVLPVRIDVDKQQAVARQYEIAAMPTLIFADSYGNELFRFSGNVSVETMTQLLNELPGDITTINRLTQIIGKDKGNFAALEELGRELRRAKLFRASNRYYDRAIRAWTPADQANRRADILVATGENHLDLKEFREAAERFDRYLQEFKRGPAEPQAMLGLARAQLLLNKRADAKRTLEALTSRYKSGTAHDQAVRLLGTL